LHPSIFILCAFKANRENINKKINKNFFIAGNFGKNRKNMEPLSEIRKSIQGMVKGTGKAGCFTAKVKAVDDDTCSVELDGLTLTDVRLRAVVNGENSKILVTPETGSYVLVADLAGDLSQLVVVGYSEVKKIEVDTDKIIFNGGNNEGLIQIKELTNKLNELVNKFNQHTHPGQFSGMIGSISVSGTIEATSIPMQIPEPFFVKSDYEDTKITH
jgi:hypothetical protein